MKNVYFIITELELQLALFQSVSIVLFQMYVQGCSSRKSLLDFAIKHISLGLNRLEVESDDELRSLFHRNVFGFPFPVAHDQKAVLIQTIIDIVNHSIVCIQAKAWKLQVGPY